MSEAAASAAATPASAAGRGTAALPALVQVRNLKMHFPIFSGLLQRRTGEVKAVDGVSFEIPAGETLGLVGESGCGKSTCGRALLRLYEPTAGQVVIDGQDITAVRPEALRQLRPTMQMVFQDPQASLNPRMTVASIVGEPLVEHTRQTKAERRERTYELLDQVGLNRNFANRYPHEFSGGQRQRIGIARALALSPEFIVCDEAISALDVSIQAQVINLLRDLQEQHNLAYLFIAHDLSVVEFLADRVAVMYLGRIVETASTEDLFRNPIHPYTKALFSAIAVPDPKRVKKRILLPGDPPSPLNPPKGCRFHPRCPIAELPLCASEEPPAVMAEDGHVFHCHVEQRRQQLPPLKSEPVPSPTPT